MISNIQMLRALAALAIVFYHTNFRISYDYHAEYQAVCVFFVISGFIMTLITAKGSGEASASSFFKHRIIRIVPLYWFATWVLVFMSHSGFLNLPATIPRLWGYVCHEPWWIPIWFLASFFPREPASVLQSILFIPYYDVNHEAHPFLSVGWTLNLEMYFYLILGLALIVTKKFAPLLASAVILAVYYYGMHVPSPNAALKLYSHGYVLFFIYGIAVCYVWRFAEPLINRKQFRPVLLGAAFMGILVFLSMNLAPHWGGAIGPGLGKIYPVLPPVLVMSLLILHSGGIRADNRMVLCMGAASYALYLTHIIFIEMMRPIGERAPAFNASTSAFGCIFTVLLCVIASLLVHHFVEIPSHKTLKRLWLNSVL